MVAPHGLPGLGDLGLDGSDLHAVPAAAVSSSSMRGNSVSLAAEALSEIIEAEF